MVREGLPKADGKTDRDTPLRVRPERLRGSAAHVHGRFDQT
jgi:hypothetical protein